MPSDSVRVSSETSNNEIILYQPDSTLALDVRLENDMVWLNRNQIALLFDRDVKTIGKHINNALREELENLPVVAKFATTAADGKVYQTEHYNIEMITSVGYRVKSKRGVLFRQWANKVLKEYMLRGYSIRQQLEYVENRIDHRLSEHDLQIKELSGKVDFILKTSLPPREGILYEGQIFDAYLLISDLMRRAKKRIILIDNYIDDTVLSIFSKRSPGVSALIYTKRINRSLALDLERHNDQYAPIDVRTAPNIHDRFLIIDEDLYHIGASIKDLGKKLFAFSKMETEPEEILERI